MDVLQMWMDETQMTDSLAALREYGALVRARDAEIADGMVGGICEDESHGGSSHDACAIQCAAAISREPLP